MMRQNDAPGGNPGAVFEQLAAGRFAEYFHSAASLSGSGPWLFVHIAKTAGTSLRQDINRVLRPATHITVRGPNLGRNRDDMFDDAIELFLQRHAATPYRLASGHLRARHTERLRAALPGLRCCTMLRDPIARLVSDYRYQRSPLNPVSSFFARQNPDFRSYFSRPHVHNVIAKALVPPALLRAGDPAEAARYILDRFDFVGVQERYTLSVRALTAAMGRSIEPTAEAYRTPQSADSVVTLTPADDTLLRQLNGFDMALVGIFTRQWDAIAADLEAYLARSPPEATL
jgi:plasmid stabilization system protein ParE